MLPTWTRLLSDWLRNSAVNPKSRRPPKEPLTRVARKQDGFVCDIRATHSTLEFAAGTPTTSVTNEYPGSVVSPLGNYGLFKVTLPDQVEPMQAASRLKSVRGVNFAEPDYLLTAKWYRMTVSLLSNGDTETPARLFLAKRVSQGPTSIPHWLGIRSEEVSK